MHDCAIVYECCANEVTILYAKIWSEPERGFEQSRCGHQSLKKYSNQHRRIAVDPSVTGESGIPHVDGIEPVAANEFRQ
jgi:hypothetical protein